jgi:hypothetical protein
LGWNLNFVLDTYGRRALSFLERVSTALQLGDAEALENAKYHGAHPLSRRFEMFLPRLEPLDLRLRQRRHALAIQNELRHPVALFQRSFKIRGQSPFDFGRQPLFFGGLRQESDAFLDLE